MYDYNAESLRLTPEARAVSAEDAPGLQAAVDALFDRHEANEQLSRDLIDAARDAKGG